MASPSRRTDPALDHLLRDEPYRFDFFQAVRLLERLQPSRHPVGLHGTPSHEVVRFRSKLSMTFPASQLDELDLSGSPDRPPRLTVAFMGLTGPLGALPYPYMELLMEQERLHGDAPAVAFLDLFNHRLISLFYRAWEKHHPIIAYERGLATPATTTVAPGWTEPDRPSGVADHLPPSNYLFQLIGLGLPALRNRHAFPDRVLLFYAGLFAQQHRPAIVLERLLCEYFQVPVAVRQFQGQWLRLSPADCTALGSRNNELGNGFLLGRRVWDEQGKFRLTIGPLNLEDYLAFLPDTAAFRDLGQLTRFYVHLELDIEVQLILKAEDVPKLELDPDPDRKPRLGRTTWLNTPKPRADADEPVFPVPRYH